MPSPINSHQILGGQIPGSRFRVGTVAQPASTGVDGTDSGLQRGESVGQRLAVGVVEVHPDVRDRDA